MCFVFDPVQVQPQNRYRLFGWMSTAHWNGHCFRSGEWLDEDIHEAVTDDDDNNRNEEIEELKNQINQETCASLEAEFLESVQQVEEICKPRMLERELAINAKKIHTLKRILERAKAGVDVVHGSEGGVGNDN